MIAIIIGIIAIAIIYSEPKIAVLNYHGVMPKEELEESDEKDSIWIITKENFEEQMKFLHNHNYKTLTMSEFCQWKDGKIDLPFKSVLITFDDGLLSTYYHAFPILKKYNLNASLFVIGKISEEIDNDENEWMGVSNSYVNKKQIENIKEEYPNIELYSHTYNMHREINKEPAVYNYTEEEMLEDIYQYEDYMGETDIIAYPFGATNETFIKVLEDEGYNYGFLLGDNKKATRQNGNFYINRINVSKDKDIFHFAGRLLLPY